MPWTLESICPDYPEWPVRWMGLEEDRAYGEDLLEAMRPFVDYLLDSGLARKTIKAHMDNLWILGGEIIREVSIGDEYEVPPKKKLREAVDPQGGPLCSHLHSESEQDSFDRTCRKLNRFLEAKRDESEKMNGEGGHSWDLRKRAGSCLSIDEAAFNRQYEEWATREWIPWLQSKLSFPFHVERKEDEDDAYFTDVAEREPFRLGHTMNVIAVMDEEIPFRGVIVKVREGRRAGYVPLCDLEVTDKSDANYWPVREYVVWDANK